MSNLKLPELTYSHLSKVLGNRAVRQLAYATDVVRDGDELQLKHHGTTIAILSADRVTILAPYNSRTTADRCHRILRDNARGTEFNIGLTQGLLSLRRGRTSRPYSSVIIETATGNVGGSVWNGSAWESISELS